MPISSETKENQTPPAAPFYSPSYNPDDHQYSVIHADIIRNKCYHRYSVPAKFQDIGGKKYQTAPPKDYLILGKNTHIVLDSGIQSFLDEPIAMFSGIDEVTVLDPGCKNLRKLYEQLKAKLKLQLNNQDQRYIKYITDNITRYVNKSFGGKSDTCIVEKLNLFLKNINIDSKKYPAIADYNGHPVIPLVYFVMLKLGVCRQRALLCAFLVDCAICEGYLPPGEVYFYRNYLNDGAHAFVIYRPYRSNAVYLLDAMWHKESHVIRNGKNFEELGYKQTIANNIENRYFKIQPHNFLLKSDVDKTEILHKKEYYKIKENDTKLQFIVGLLCKPTRERQKVLNLQRLRSLNEIKEFLLINNEHFIQFQNYFLLLEALDKEIALRPGPFLGRQRFTRCEVMLAKNGKLNCNYDGHDYVEVDTNDAKNVLLEGGFGRVRILAAIDNPNLKLAVKQPKFIQGDEIITIKRRLVQESGFNKRVHGIGAYSGNVSSADERFYIIMAYFSGTTLDHFKFDNVSVFFKVLIAICEALHELHKLKVIHGDINPKNIIIQGSYAEGYKAIFVDFGFSKINDPGETRDPLTTSHQPPELINCPPPNQGQDIYSLAYLINRLYSINIALFKITAVSSYIDDFFIIRCKALCLGNEEKREKINASEIQTILIDLHNFYVPIEHYVELQDSITATNFNPGEWLPYLQRAISTVNILVCVLSNHVSAENRLAWLKVLGLVHLKTFIVSDEELCAILNILDQRKLDYLEWFNPSYIYSLARICKILVILNDSYQRKLLEKMHTKKTLSILLTEKNNSGYVNAVRQILNVLLVDNIVGFVEKLDSTYIEIFFGIKNHLVQCICFLQDGKSHAFLKALLDKLFKFNQQDHKKMLPMIDLYKTSTIYKELSVAYLEVYRDWRASQPETYFGRTRAGKVAAANALLDFRRAPGCVEKSKKLVKYAVDLSDSTLGEISRRILLPT